MKLNKLLGASKSQGVYYIVKSGDTLSGIATKYKTTVSNSKLMVLRIQI